MNERHTAFTLIELLVVIAIIAVLSVVVILSLNPTELLRQTRDGGRISDMDTVNRALGLTQVEGLPLGTVNVVYVSIPDPTATSTAGDQCQGLGLPSLPATYTYHCAASSTYRQVNGTGWVPVNFTNLAQGTPMGQLPTDPVNTTSSRLYYTYVTNGYQYETTAVMESSKYKLGGDKDVTGTDGGTLASVYEKGTKLGLEPLDYGDNSLVGYWTFDEGSGSIAYDYSGSNATGSWSGTPAGTNGYYSAGKVGSWAGTFVNGNPPSNNFVSEPNNGALDVTSAFTWTMWVNVASIDGSAFDRFFSKEKDSDNCYLSTIGISGTALRIYINSGGIGYSAYSGANGGVGAWAFWSVVFNQGNLKIYLNGADVTVAGGGGSCPTNTSLNIGSFNNGSSPSLKNALVDDFRIYNRALSASEIAAMYAGGK